jgi:hypothetical protein
MIMVVVATIFSFFVLMRRSTAFRYTIDRLGLKIPVIGDILEKATIARWTRTLSTMFAAGVPLVESLDAVAGASGNMVYAAGTKRVQTEVSTGASLTNAMTNTKLFPSMVLQMTQIGEESGSLDGMLAKIAEFYEREVDDAVGALSSLLEPIIIVFLGVVIGGLVVAMYLPISSSARRLIVPPGPRRVGLRGAAPRARRRTADARPGPPHDDRHAGSARCDGDCRGVGLCVGSFLNVVIHRLRSSKRLGAVLRAARGPRAARLQPLVPDPRARRAARHPALQNIGVVAPAARPLRGCRRRSAYPVVEVLGGLRPRRHRASASRPRGRRLRLLWALLALT